MRHVYYFIRTMGIVLSLFGGLTMQVAAKELPDIVRDRFCSSVRHDLLSNGKNNSRNCTNLGSVLKVKLRADIGTIHLSVPSPDNPNQREDVSLGQAFLYNDSLTPEVWRVDAGDTLDITLSNHLGSAPWVNLPTQSGAVSSASYASNLHTHGLIVAPSPLTEQEDGQQIAGDNVHVCTYPKGANKEVCAGLNVPQRSDTAHYKIQIPKQHPEGTYWYHPHIHQIASVQVGGGMSGLIWVQQKKNDTHSLRDGSNRAFNGVERFVMLKDLMSDDGSTISTNKKPPEKDKCKEGQTGWTICDNPHSDGGSMRWYFTLNGEVYPTISMKHEELWHIANTSANVSYKLSLRNKQDKNVEFDVKERDGVPANLGMTEYLTLMPGSRVSVIVPQVDATLMSEDAGSKGDYFPTVKLAEVNAGVNTKKTNMPHAQGLAQSDNPPSVYSVKETFSLEEIQTGLAAQEAKKNKNNKKTPAQKLHSHMAIPEKNVQTCSPLNPEKLRLLVLQSETKGQGNTHPNCAFNEGENFCIGVNNEVSDKIFDLDHPNQTLEKSAITNTLNALESFGHGANSHICVNAGDKETWVIANESEELHNFHLHQTRFDVIGEFDPLKGRPQYINLQADSYPVPIGGWIKIKVKFGEGQVGELVYHCHILEHEDKGMMAHISVLPATAKQNSETSAHYK